MGKDNVQYYNYNNLNEYVNKMGLCYDGEYFRWLKDIINTKVSLIKYKNLPKGLTSRVIETALLFNNFLCWANVPSVSKEPILCRYIYAGKYDLYWRPEKVTLLTLSGKTIKTDVPYEEIIPCRDNVMDIIPFLTLNSWIDKIIEMERTLKINIQLLRLPTLFTGSKEQVATLKQIIMKVTNFEPFAVGDKSLINSIQPVKFDLPVKPSDLYELIEQYKNMALASVGIYSSDSKRERLITAEIQASNDFADIVYQGMLEERREWVKLVNEKYNLNIEIVETYYTLHKDNVKEQAEETLAITKAETKGTEGVDKEDGRDKGNE